MYYQAKPMLAIPSVEVQLALQELLAIKSWPVFNTAQRQEVLVRQKTENGPLLFPMMHTQETELRFKKFREA